LADVPFPIQVCQIFVDTNTKTGNLT
jgi:hypothetical protein